MLNTVPNRLPTTLPFRPRWILPADRYWSDEIDAPSFLHCGERDAPDGDDAGRYDRVWQEHIPHTGRRPPEKGIANFRGVTTDADRNEIVLESTLEQAAARIALADPRVERLRPQVGRVYYTDANGDDRHSTLDFVATGPQDKTLGIAVKPRRKVASSGIEATVAAIRDQHPDFSDEIAVWTEENLPRFAEHNAGLILRSRKLRNDDDVSAMTDLSAKIHGTVHVGHLVRHSPCGHARALTAVVNLIDDGFLVPAPNTRIGANLPVRLAA